ncbi:MAG: hypothetical protein K0Q60_1684 [Microvirga sp.]|nr:hypothetical protein [Microvirga sp.]
MPSMANPPPALAKELRHCLAAAISDFKAYDVPAVCKRLGLGDGTAEEAFSSKYKYASSRIASRSLDEVLGAARALLAEHEDFPLTEAAHKVEETRVTTISEITRRRIAALFDGKSLCTEIEEIDLLRRIWPIETMPSVYQSSDRHLADDIRQHTINNDDWSNRELLENLGAFTCSQAQFFRFLEHVTDPLAQKPERQAELVANINVYLAHDHYRLLQIREASGCPYYAVKPAPKGSPADAAITEVLKAFDPGDIHGRWEAAMKRRETEPAGAITLARTLLEDVCKWIIHEAGEEWAESDDLPILYRKLAKILKLAPDDHTEQVFRQILGSCQSIVESLGSLRNKLGDAHSIGPRRARPAPRHAELAVNLSGAMSTFLVSTWKAMQDNG